MALADVSTGKLELILPTLLVASKVTTFPVTNDPLGSEIAPLLAVNVTLPEPALTS